MVGAVPGNAGEASGQSLPRGRQLDRPDFGAAGVPPLPSRDFEAHPAHCILFASRMVLSAASHALLCLAAAACLLRGAAAADLMGSATQGGLQLSCTTPQTCGTLQNREWGASGRILGL